MGFTGSSQKKLSTSLPTNIPSETEERSPGYPSTASYTKLPSGTSYTKLRKAEKPALSSSDEGDALNSSVMISNLLSKLDSVKVCAVSGSVCFREDLLLETHESSLSAVNCFVLGGCCW